MPIGDEQWVNEQLAQLAAQRPAAMPTGTPDDGTRPSWTGLLGTVLGGGQTPGYKLRGGEADTSGNRALLNFGIQTLLASGPAPVRPDLLSAVASGLQGAQSSTDLDQRRAQASAVAQQGFADKQQEMRLAALKEALPLLKLQQEQRALAGLKGGATSTAAGPAGDPGFTGDKAKDLALIAKRESGGDPTALNYVAKEDPTAYERGATASGKYQIVNSTWAEGMRLAGLDPSKYVTARSAPEAVQDQVASALYDKYGSKPWVKGARDWVKGADGKYQLAAVAPSAPAAPSGPPAAPGAVPAPSGVQVGGTPPPPPGAAPGAPAGPGGMAAALPAPGSPTTVLRETQERGPDGQVRTVVRPMPATPPATPANPQVSANVGAILGGIENARTATPASAMPAVAGPGAPAPTAQPQPRPEAGWGTGVPGAYGYGGGSPPPGVAAPGAAPVAPVPGGAAPPAATPPPAMAVPPPFAMRPLTPTEAAATSYALDPQTEKSFADRLQASVTVPEALAVKKERDAALEARRNAADTARLEIEKTERTAHNAQWQEQQKQRNAIEAERIKQEAAAAAALKLEQAKADAAERLEGIKSDNQNKVDDRKRFSIERDGARTAIDSLQTLQILSDAAGRQTPLEGLNLPGGGTGRDLMVKLGLGTDAAQAKWGAQYAFNAAKNQMIIELRKGVSMGQLSDRDMSFLQGMGPDLMNDPATRREMIALLENANQHKRAYLDKVEELHDEGKGLSWAKAKIAADKAMPKMIPELPNGYANLSAPEQSLWKQQHFRPGQVVRGTDGTLMLYRPQPQQ